MTTGFSAFFCLMTSFAASGAAKRILLEGPRWTQRGWHGYINPGSADAGTSSQSRTGTAILLPGRRLCSSAVLQRWCRVGAANLFKAALGPDVRPHMAILTRTSFRLLALDGSSRVCSQVQTCYRPKLLRPDEECACVRSCWCSGGAEA